MAILKCRKCNAELTEELVSFKQPRYVGVASASSSVLPPPGAVYVWRSDDWLDSYSETEAGEQLDGWFVLASESALEATQHTSSGGGYVRPKGIMWAHSRVMCPYGHFVGRQLDWPEGRRWIAFSPSQVALTPPSTDLGTT
ncbi:MAG: hypothetical protein IT384_33925 [Deltaproteobacteria bacterium]|nr:hypothetical protein [Deltaproteobacteria bacterium]